MGEPKAKPYRSSYYEVFLILHHSQQYLFSLILLRGGNQLIKVALIQAILNDSILLKLAFRKCLCDGSCHFSLVLKDIRIVDLNDTTKMVHRSTKKAIESTRKKVYNHKAEIEAWFANDGKYRNSAFLADIISALTKNDIDTPFGHYTQYWSTHKTVSLEVFADIGGIDVLDIDGSEELTGILSDLYAAYKEIIKRPGWINWQTF